MHLGQDDIDVAQAKKLLLKPTVIGKSTHNLNQLKDAIAELPTYVGLGPAFDTQTKPMEKTAGLRYLENAVPVLADAGVAGVAIGGIDLKNLAAVLKIGVKAVAVCSAITKSDNPQLACAKFKEILADKEF
jgi:thiamine-phosphate pyrophosphorylase